MIAMRVMQASAHQIIDVIPMRHGFVPAGRTMFVRAARLRRALHRIGGIDRDDVLVDAKPAMSRARMLRSSSVGQKINTIDCLHWRPIWSAGRWP
jgi:hypothetical protein